MRSIDTEIEIAASAERVWAILTNFAAYPQWNPFITAVEGRAEEGARLRVCVRPPGMGPLWFNPSVRALVRQRELSWIGRFFLPGLFDGEHRMSLEDRGRSCVFRHGERFGGLLVPLAGARVFEPTRQGFELMNAALKERAETGAARA